MALARAENKGPIQAPQELHDGSGLKPGRFGVMESGLFAVEDVWVPPIEQEDAWVLKCMEESLKRDLKAIREQPAPLAMGQLSGEADRVSMASEEDEDEEEEEAEEGEETGVDDNDDDSEDGDLAEMSDGGDSDAGGEFDDSRLESTSDIEDMV